MWLNKFLNKSKNNGNHWTSKNNGNHWTSKIQHFSGASIATDGKNVGMDFDTNKPDTANETLQNWFKTAFTATLQLAINPLALERAIRLAKTFEHVRLNVIVDSGRIAVVVTGFSVERGDCYTRIEATLDTPTTVAKVSYYTNIDASMWLKALSGMNKLDSVVLGIDTIDIDRAIKLGIEGVRLFLVAPFKNVSASRIDDTHNYMFDYEPMTVDDAKNKGKKHTFKALFKRKKHTPKFIDRKPRETTVTREKFVKQAVKNRYNRWDSTGHEYDDKYKNDDGTYTIPVSYLNLTRLHTLHDLKKGKITGRN